MNFNMDDKTSLHLKVTEVTGGGGGGSDNYNDLSNKPKINNITLSGNKSLEDLGIIGAISEAVKVVADALDAFIKTLAKVAETGDYNDLENKPNLDSYVKEEDLSQVATSGDYEDLSNKPDLSEYMTRDKFADVAFSGSYADLQAVPEFSDVAMSGNYNDLTNVPTIPSAVSQLLNDSDYQTEDEVNAAITKALADISGVQLKVVSQLPTTGDAGTIYLLPKADSEERNIYDEFVYVNNAWEKIGDTQPALSDYAKQSDLDALDERVETIENSYVDMDYVDGAVEAGVAGLASEDFVLTKIGEAIGGALNGSY